MRRRSPNASRARRTISSVTDDLPEPPVPVIPRTGAGDDRPRPGRRPAAARSPGATSPRSMQVTARASAPKPPARSSSQGARSARGSRASRARSNTSSIIPWRPIRWPSSGV